MCALYFLAFALGFAVRFAGAFFGASCTSTLACSIACSFADLVRTRPRGFKGAGASPASPTDLVFLCLGGTALVIGGSSASKTSDFLFLDPAVFEAVFVG